MLLSSGFFHNIVGLSNRKKFISLRLLFEISILSIFPYPYLTGKITYMQANSLEKSEDYVNSYLLCYTVAEFLYIFMFSRLFFIVRTMINFTPYQDDHARFCCAKSEKKANVRFAIRCMMKTHPFLMIYGTSFCSFVLLGIIIRLFERPYSAISGQNFESFQNSMWVCAESMSTIGYGEMFPSTILGRLVGLICAMWGAFVFSMIVFTFQKMFKLSKNQQLAFSSIKQTRAAARVIVACFTYQVYKVKEGAASDIAGKQMKRVLVRLKKFKETIKRLKMIDNGIEEIEISNAFTGLSQEVTLLAKNIERLKKK